jgi:DNA-binding response OmpR family regulator
VEDDQDVLDSYQKIFKKFFKTVYSGKNGLEGFELYQKHKPDLIITDIKMPELSGIGMAKKIRAEDKETIIVFLTAYTETDDLLNAIDLQPVKYFVKPVTAKDIIQYFESTFSSSGASSMVQLEFGFVYDRNNREVKDPDGGVHPLTKMESDLLNLLIEKMNEIVAYDEIDRLWGDKFMSVNSLRTLIKNIRHKTYPTLIDNIPNIGYRIYFRDKPL